MDEEDTTVFDGSESTRPTTVVCCGGLRQAGEKISISVGAALAILEGVAERGEEFEPPLDSLVVVPYLTDALKCFVDRKHAKLRAPQVTSESLDGPGNAASFQVQRGLVPLGIEGSAADISHGPYPGVRLLLFEHGTKTVDAGVAEHVEGAGAVGYGVPVMEDQNRWGSELGEDLADDNIIAGVKTYLTPFRRRAVRGRIRLDRSGRNLR